MEAVKNKKASFNYEILETFEAGLVLRGAEVKSIKGGHISLKEAYIGLQYDKKKRPRPYLLKAYISPYKPAGNPDSYDPTRPRPLLLKKTEITKLIGKIATAGLTLIPLKVYTKNSFVKLEFALASGKKKYDKRETIKKREMERELRTLTKRQRQE